MGVAVVPVTKPRTQFDSDKFYAFLNSKDDLTAVVHGMSSIEVLLDGALRSRLQQRGIKDDGLRFLGTMQKVDALIVADALDGDLRALFAHMVAIRNRFAHHLETSITKRDAQVARERMPVPDDSKPTGPPGAVVRLALVLLGIRVMNRAHFGHDASLPYL